MKNVISKQIVLQNTLPILIEKGRELDVLRLRKMLAGADEKLDALILDSLLRYQNEDGGFGNGLEPDVQAAVSSVLATNLAMEILKEVDDCPAKELMVKKAVWFLESKFDKKRHQFEFVPTEIQDFPHADWWNDPSVFGYFNPTHEVFSFLCKHGEFLKIIDLEEELDVLIEAIRSDAFAQCDQEHSIYAVVKLFHVLDEPRKAMVKDAVSDAIRRTICLDETKWPIYAAQPYKFFINADDLLAKEYEDALERNFSYLKKIFDKEYIWWPDWKWSQFEDLFEEKVKFEWLGSFTMERLKAFEGFGLLA